MDFGVGALETGATQHHMHVVGANIVPYSLPQQFHDGPRAVRLQHAGAAEFEKPQLRVSRNEGSNVEFSLRVEPAMSVRHLLPQQPVSADQLAICQMHCIIRCDRSAADHHQVVTERVEAIGIHAPLGHVTQRRGAKLLVEDLVAKSLAGGDLLWPAGQTQYEFALLDAYVL